MENIDLAPGYTIPRIVRGAWQLSAGHGPVDRARALAEVSAFVDQGFDVVDCADIYTGVEEFIGEARTVCPRLRVHTKCVPDLAELAQVDFDYVRATVERSLRRLRIEALDLLQFHWWDYRVEGMERVLGYLDTLRRQGLVRQLGLTNFDCAHTARLLDTGVPLVSTQVQYSLLDRRPARGLGRLCQQKGMRMLCYGALAGGFLSERWLGQPEPKAEENRSQTKYRLVIGDFGGWAAFQQLLQLLAVIAAEHAVSLASVALRWVLEQPGVGAVIVGARYAHHIPGLHEVMQFGLTEQDHQRIADVLARHPGPEGEVFALERDREGRHGRIMKYNLNRV